MRALKGFTPLAYVILLLVTLSAVSIAQAPSGNAGPGQKTPALLHLVDVLTMDTKTGLPATTLQRDDFEIYDNRQLVTVETFSNSVQYKTRPLAVWFALICNQLKFDQRGSGFVRGKTAHLRPALDEMDKNDRIGVAHWCDSGASAIDVALTRDRQAPLDAIETLMSRPPTMYEYEEGEPAFKHMVQMIVDASREPDHPVPVVIMIHGDSAGMYRKDLDPIRDLLLERSAFVYGLNDGSYTPTDRSSLTYQEPMLHWLAVETGGQWFSVKPELFGAALKEVLQQLHFRYTLGFKPLSLDGKRHEVTVKLTQRAKQQNKNVKIRYRPAYIPTAD
jgi:hypothetical protein